MHEVPFCFDFHVNNTTLECLPGPRSSRQWPTRQLSASLPELIAKQVAFPPDSYSKQELSVRTLWLDTKMMVSHTKLIVHESFSKPTRIHCETVSLSARLVFETRAKCQDLWPGTRMMVSLTWSIVIFAVLIPISLSASPNQLRIEKLEDGLRLCGKLWPRNSMKSSLNEMLKFFSLSLHLTPVHKSSAFRIAGTECGSRFSNFHHPDANIHLILLLLVCAILAILMMCCDRSFVTPARRAAYV